MQVFTDPDERFWLGVGLTRSRKYVVIEAGSNITSETWLLDAADPTGEFTVVWPRKDGVEYDVEHVVAGGRDRLLITHNDGAVNFELVSVAADDPQGPRRMLLPHSEAMRIEGVDAFRDFVALEYRRDGLPRVAVATFHRLRDRRFAEPVEASRRRHPPRARVRRGALGRGPLIEPRLEPAPQLRIGYGSFVTPSTVIDVVVSTGERIVRKQQPVLGDYDPRGVHPAQRVGRGIRRRPRADLARLPHRPRRAGRARADAPLRLRVVRVLDRPRLLHRTPLAARPRHRVRGRACARRRRARPALVRARQEAREEAHVQRFRRGRSPPGRHGCHGARPARRAGRFGGGGLLMGAVANLAPKLFSGILAEVPFVDALTSILDPDLPPHGHRVGRVGGKPARRPPRCTRT